MTQPSVTYLRIEQASPAYGFDDRKYPLLVKTLSYVKLFDPASVGIDDFH